MKTPIVQQRKHQLRHNICKHVNFVGPLNGICLDFKNMRISYNLTKRTTKKEKIEKFLKILKMYNIINFKTIRYKLAALGVIIN